MRSRKPFFSMNRKFQIDLINKITSCKDVLKHMYYFIEDKVGVGMAFDIAVTVTTYQSRSASKVRKVARGLNLLNV